MHVDVDYPKDSIPTLDGGERSSKVAGSQRKLLNILLNFASYFCYSPLVLGSGYFPLISRTLKTETPYSGTSLSESWRVQTHHKSVSKTKENKTLTFNLIRTFLFHI